MKEIRIAVFTALLCLTFASGTRAQLRWHVTHNKNVPPYVYTFDAVSSYGETCTATGLIWDTTIHSRINSVRIMLFRSTDGGETWTEQDPGLPRERSNALNQLTVVQQIDSLSAVAIGDTGLIVRTFDGGVTWERQSCNTLANLLDVHFSDPMTGIVIANGDTDVFTTSDGGRHWRSTVLPSFGYYPVTGHSDGAGRFRVMDYEAGPFYSTSDWWQSIDSSDVFPRSDISNVVYYCSYLSADTLIAYGSNFRVSGDGSPRLTMTRSLDGGHTWAQMSVPDSVVTSPGRMSDLSRDFVLMPGRTTSGHIRYGISEDHGMSWHFDPLVPDTLDRTGLASVTVTPKGNAIGIFHFPTPRGIPGTIAVGKRGIERVDGVERIIYSTSIYPNPGSDRVAIASPAAASRPVWLIDVLGRVVLRDKLDASGNVTLNVSTLPAGIYGAMLDVDGKTGQVGKVVVAKATK